MLLARRDLRSACLALLAVLTAVAGLTAPIAPDRAAAAPGGKDPVDPADVTAVTFNALGHGHTRPGGNKCCTWDQAPKRTRGLVQVLAGHGFPALVGLQEFTPVQKRVFVRNAGKVYNLWGDVDNHVAWRPDTFKLVGTRTVTIPYLRNHDRRMPVVTLRHLPTGRTTTVINVHNPAGKSPEAAKDRSRAVTRELKVVRQEQAKGRAVVLVGDFNDKQGIFCRAARAGLASANPGTAKPCAPPRRPSIDWIFAGGQRVADYRVDGSVYGTISDHRMILSRIDY